MMFDFLPRPPMSSRMVFVAITLVVAMAACGGSIPERSGQRAGALPRICPQPVGAYVITLDLTGGDCRGVKQHITKLEVIGEPASPNCRVINANALPIADGCRYEETQSCVVSSLDARGTLTLDVVRDLTDLRGNYVFQAQEQGRRCMATYSARFQKAGSAR
jgi:hypothetical protein